jgi:hypothetical protein
MLAMGTALLQPSAHTALLDDQRRSTYDCAIKTRTFRKGENGHDA